MKEVLIDGGEFAGEHFIENIDNLGVALHDGFSVRIPPVLGKDEDARISSGF